MADDRDFPQETKNALEIFEAQKQRQNILPPNFIEFVEWIWKEEQWFFNGQTWFKKISFKDGVMEKTTQQLYEYWLTNIKK